MQVNSAQDWVTAKKRQLIAKTYHTIPPPQSRRHNGVFLSAMANEATQTRRILVPRPSGWGSAPGTTAAASDCCLSNGSSTSPGTFTTTTDRGIVRFNIIAPMSVTATRPVGS